MGEEPSMADADKDKLKKDFELRAFAVERKMRGKYVSPSDLTDADFLAWARVKRAAEITGAGCTSGDGDEPPRGGDGDEPPRGG
jgi:hypothetical protein